MTETQDLETPPSLRRFPKWHNSKEFTCRAGDSYSTPGLERFPGGGNGNPLLILAWRISWTEEPGGLQSMGSQRLRYDLATEHTHTFNQNMSADNFRFILFIYLFFATVCSMWDLSSLTRD